MSDTSRFLKEFDNEIQRSDKRKFGVGDHVNISREQLANRSLVLTRVAEIINWHQKAQMLTDHLPMQTVVRQALRELFGI